MADGSSRPIRDVNVGDEVLATDPVKGGTQAKPVTALHLNRDEDLTDVHVIVVGGGPRAPNAAAGVSARAVVLKTTAHHPFWDADAGRWTDAGKLRPGASTLRGPDGTQYRVTAVRNHTGAQWMRDLTVADTHTYYVVAGNTPVLVHNCNNVISNADGYDNTGALGAHSPGTGFSGVYDPQSGAFRAHLSVPELTANSPVNAVPRRGGHGMTNRAHFGDSRQTVGFTMFFEEGGGFGVEFFSRGVTGRNYGSPFAPEELRQGLMDAIANATGRSVRAR